MRSIPVPAVLISAAAILVPMLVLDRIGLAWAEDTMPERVLFPSADSRTTLVGYMFRPAHPGAAQVPAVVMMHGRAGAYSSAANGRFDASTLSQRHQMWGRLWAARGYIAILVDGFGPRGYPHGFPRFSYDSRPEELNEVTVRPLDAYGALAYLGSRRDVMPDRIGLQGWSNGASAVLATMAAAAPPAAGRASGVLFRAALAFYPACGLKGQFEEGISPYAPVRVLQGDADEEVSPRRCAAFVGRSKAQGGDIDIVLYPGATHDFDDPGRSRQALIANASAKDDAMARAQQLFCHYLGGCPQ
jgi:dienelactone hydrolase